MNKELENALKNFIESEVDFSKILPTISDFNQLSKMWKNTSSDSEPKKMIESRMEEVLAKVTIENIPPWFKDIIFQKKIPNFLLESFKKKAKELLNS